MSFIRRGIARFITVFRPSRAERELAREIGAHLQLLEDQFVARGMSREDARYAARRAFGGVEQAKEHHRDARSYRWIGGSWLDLKLGARMLVKSPGLAIVGGLGMAVAIALATAGFTIASTLLRPSLPLPGSDRIVALQYWSAATRNPEGRILHDVLTWRDELTTFEDVGAFRTVGRNLAAPGVPPEVVGIAEISASAFTITRVPPLLGRPLLETDEQDGATPVAVIGEHAWRRRFAADPAILGRTIRLGSATHTVVGVMPEGYAFPINHQFWIPLRLDAARYGPGDGPHLTAFGRLRPDVSRRQAQAELTAIGRRTAAAHPQIYEHLRPRIVPYTHPFTDMDDPGNAAALGLMQVLITLLLVVVAVNVAVLVYARTAMRHAEIAVRTALGASRRRIVAQLFLEALVLSLVAAAAGLVLTGIGLRQLDAAMVRIAGDLPFWMTFTLTPSSVVFVLGLAVLAAAIVGILPALKATGARVQTRLKDLGAGASGLRLGRTWTMLIVVQVALAVALLPPVVYHASQLLRQGTGDPGFAAGEYLAAQLTMDRSALPAQPSPAIEREFASRFEARYAELASRLRADPAVAGVTFGMGLPGEEATVWIEVEGVRTPGEAESAYASGYAVREGTGAGHEARFGRIDPGYFETYGVPVLAGRGFDARDAGPDATGVIVNRAFAERILGGANAVGRRLRYVGRSGDARPDQIELGRWYEIVGVTADFPARPLQPGAVDARLYHATTAAQLYPVSLSVRVRNGEPSSLTGRLREVAAGVDPDLQLRRVEPLDQALGREQSLMRLVAVALGALTVSVVLLSAAGIYALMSFTVVQRRREIGIRSALGADARRLLLGIFARAARQLAAGAVIGIGAAALLERVSDGDLLEGQALVVLPIVAVVMMLVGLLAALGPARRGLRIQPTEALRQT
jgi:putative ABC transport system permease protein